MGYTIKQDAKYAVVGYGSWATALVKILLENEKCVWWHIRNDEVAEHIKTNGNNPKYLSDVEFDPSRLVISADIDQIVGNADVVILAVPSAFLQLTLQPLTVSLKDKFIVSAVKGIIPDRLNTVAEYVSETYEVPFDQIGIITGPCHAEEVALERLSYLTIVGKNIENAERIGTSLKTSYINVNPSTDIYGTEYASVLKNIYAIAVGIAVGQGYGDNFMAVLISNSALEMNRFLTETFPCDRNIAASAYLGDLLVTAYSQFSRNRRFGVMIGKGYSVRATQIELNMVAEGFYGAECVEKINKKHMVDMPIAKAVYDILYANANVKRTMKELTTKLI